MSQEFTQEKWNYTDFNMENHDITFDGEGKQSVLISIPFESDVPKCVKEKLNEVIGLGMAEWLRCGTLDGLLESCIPNPKDLLLNARMQVSYDYELGVEYLITIVITSIHNDLWVDKSVTIHQTDKLLHNEFASYCRYKLDKILFPILVGDIVLYDEKEAVEICKKYGIETVEKEGYPLYQGKEMDENFSIADIMHEPILITEE